MHKVALTGSKTSGSIGEARRQRSCQLARDNVEKLCLSREADGPLGRGTLVHVITLALKLVDGWVKYETCFLEICIGLFHD